LGCAAGELAYRRTAVTLQDFERLALRTPGADVARAYARSGFHPDFPCLNVPGCLTVVVIPGCGGKAPEPSAGMLAAVQRYLDRRRPVGTELHVTGPDYVAIRIQARLHAAPGAPPGLAERGRAALEGFFHPLDGGPQGQGWPAGRPVTRSEVAELLNTLPGVAYVDEIRIRIGEGEASNCDQVELCPNQAPVSGGHEIRVQGNAGQACLEKSETDKWVQRRVES
jgi:predicted phage baseplate assembly protein